MGVYLPNVDMPIGDETITVLICPDGSIWQRFRGTVPGVKAVPVPPHGRLIDADALTRKLQSRWSVAYDYEFANHDVWREIREAPIIIEAEE